VQLREQERNEAQDRARIAEGRAAALRAENNQLARKNAHLSEQSNRLAVECPASAPVRQIEGFRERRISGSS
jgi:hypothetical protein